MNKSLRRQLEKVGLNETTPPNAESWSEFLLQVSQFYSAGDQDRYLLERSLSIMSDEMQERWESLRKNELLIRTILDSSIDAIITLAADGTIVDFNPAAEVMFGWKKNEIIGQPLPEMRIETSFTKGSDDGGRQTVYFHRSDGTEFLAEIVTRRIQLKEGTTFSTTYIRDLTEQRSTEAIIEEQRARLLSSTKMAALGEMAAGIAHEINTPLNVISLSAEYLHQEIDQAVQDRAHMKKSSQVILATVGRIAKIVKGLRLFSRDGSVDPLRPVSVSSLIEDTLALCRERFKNHGVELKLYLEVEPVQLNCRATEVSQVLLNLLSNAYDAVENLPERWIQVESKFFENEIWISVSDSGPRIPPEIEAKLMQPFFTTKELGKGTGIGLSISKGIMESHGGHLIYNRAAPHTCFVMQFQRKETSTGPQTIAA